MKNCVKCGTELVEGALFCGNCGTRVEEKHPACGGCGNNNITLGQKFCQTCGASLAATEPAEVAPAIPAKVVPAKKVSAPVPKAPASPTPEKETAPVDDSLFDSGVDDSPVLVITAPNGEKSEFRINGDNVVIGSDAKADLVLKDEFASRRHAQICKNADGQYVITDLGSRNGLFVLTKECALSDGVKVLIGRNLMEFHGRD